VRNPKTILANPQAHCFGIGDFYVGLTTQLFGGTILPRGNDHRADIDHKTWNARFEVKGAGNTNGVGIFTEQLDEYLEELGREREHCFYAVYRYASRAHIPEERISRTPTLGALYKELAERTRELYIVDVRILNALRHRNGTGHLRRDNQTEEALWLWRRTLEEITATVPLLTRIVGFRQGHFKVIRSDIRTAYENFPMKFPATFIVPRTLEEKVQNRLKKLDRLAAQLTREPLISFD